MEIPDFYVLIFGSFFFSDFWFSYFCLVHKNYNYEDLDHTYDDILRPYEHLNTKVWGWRMRWQTFFFHLFYCVISSSVYHLKRNCVVSANNTKYAVMVCQGNIRKNKPPTIQHPWLKIIKSEWFALKNCSGKPEKSFAIVLLKKKKLILTARRQWQNHHIKIGKGIFNRTKLLCDVRKNKLLCTYRKII